jgi:hypothetical protein
MDDQLVASTQSQYSSFGTTMCFDVEVLANALVLESVGIEVAFVKSYKVRE